MPSSKKGIGYEEVSTPSYKGKEEHDIRLLVLTISMVVIFCGSLLISNSERWGWLPTSMGNTSYIYPTDLTPVSLHGLAFSIWIVVYIWQMLWLTYALVNLCRRNDYGPVYLNPPIINMAFAVAYIMGQVATIAWYFVWMFHIVWASFIFIAIVTVCVWTCIALLTRRLLQNRENFTSRVDLWICRILLLNGLSIFGTWTALVTHINLAMMFIYDFGTTIDVGTTIAVVTVFLLVIAYVFLDHCVWDSYLRYNALSFPVVIWVTSAILDNRLREDDFNIDANFVLAAILFSVVCVAFVLKVVLLVVRSGWEP